MYKITYNDNYNETEKITTLLNSFRNCHMYETKFKLT